MTHIHRPTLRSLPILLMLAWTPAMAMMQPGDGAAPQTHGTAKSGSGSGGDRTPPGGQGPNEEHKDVQLKSMTCPHCEQDFAYFSSHQWVQCPLCHEEVNTLADAEVANPGDDGAD